MDCNKDEAVRAKEIAEKKLAEKDVSGAKRFVSKAQSLFPGLDGLSQFQEILDIFTAVEGKINGEVNWYKVLGVDPFVDDETIRKRYRKLALALHPDKNKVVGAEGAFKIITEAWSLLSDKVRKAVYDQKLHSRGTYGKDSGNPSWSMPKSGMYNFPCSSTAARSSFASSNHQTVSPPSVSNCGTKFTSSATAARNAPASSNLQANSTPNMSNGSTFINLSTTAKKSSAKCKPKTCSAPSKSNGYTFWTLCKICMTYYEYASMYLNKKLLCSQCHLPFLAIEMPPPPSKSNASRNLYGKKKSGYPASKASSDLKTNFTSTSKLGTTGFSYHSMTGENIPVDSSFKFGGSGSMPLPAMDAAQTVHSFRSTGDYLKREHEEAFSGAVNLNGFGKKSNAINNADGFQTNDFPIIGKGVKSSKKRRVDEHKLTSGRESFLNQKPPSGVVGRSNNDFGNNAGEMETKKLSTPGNVKSNSTMEFPHSDICKLLLEKARMEICKKLQEYNSAQNTLLLDKVDIKMKKDIPSVSAPEKSVVAGMMEVRNSIISVNREHISMRPGRCPPFSDATCSDRKTTKVEPLSDPISERLKEFSHNGSAVVADTETYETISVSVPDPEFYNFDKDRIEQVFAENQVWAAYDNEDGMPRFYAIIHDVISMKPFKVHISWLNSKSNLLNWVGCGFTKTCGEFRVGKHLVTDKLNIFSHRVKWNKAPRGVIHIFPRKGDIWALYRNWSSDWNELTPDDVKQQYDMVEVVQDYNEEGVVVAPLIKVAGFRSVFHKHLDPSKVYTIPREEMFRFSHQVLSYLLTGQEAGTSPKGCRELDTAAMPLELLQTMKEPMEADGSIAEELSGIGEVDARSISNDAKDVVREKIVMHSINTSVVSTVGDTSIGKVVITQCSASCSP